MHDPHVIFIAWDICDLLFYYYIIIIISISSTRQRGKLDLDTVQARYM